MKLHRSVFVLAALGGAALVFGSAFADEKKKETPKEVVISGELINADLKDKVLTQSFCKTYTYKMIAGHTYQIDLQSGDFDAYLRLEDPKGKQVAADDDSGGGLNARIIYQAKATGDFTVCAMSLGGGSTGKFTLILKDNTPAGDKKKAGGKDKEKEPEAGKAIELKNEKGSATANSSIAANDPLYKTKRHKLFLFPMEEGKTYEINMTSNAIDSYLYLEDPDGKLLAMDDDGGGFPNARITIKAATAGKHRIIATYFGNANGDFTLSIEEKK